MKWEIQYMVDPGDGLISKEIVTSKSDEITDVIHDWQHEPTEEGDEHFKEYFIVSVSCLGDEE